MTVFMVLSSWLEAIARVHPLDPSFTWWMQTQTAAKPLDQAKQLGLLPSTSTVAILLFLCPKADTHFTVLRRVEGWVDLGTAVKNRLSNKLFFIWLLTTPPHLKYVATLPCNWSLIACFLTWMFHKVVCQHRQGDTMWNDAGSCAWPISDDNNDFAANLPKNLSVKKMWKSVKIWQKYGHEFVASLFWPSL